ncbi:MAG: tol-pal system-associated acyl-CoA thioesterase [Hyphomicrobiales bacterium]|nr:tol-pal system-associated acyl-CoA thioesterase [Rickettsiales bacterium]MCP5361194.1 tol-pal system-associated acyl-CoA thioesterase [Hyphomicrobiales bacterium]
MNTSHTHKIRVYYEDTDAGGVVYYANYLKFAERARTEMLRAAGIEQTRLAQEQDVLFAVRRVALDIRRPARLDDVVTVETSVTALGGARITMQQTLRCDGEILAVVDVEIACITSAFTPARLPQNVKDALANG